MKSFLILGAGTAGTLSQTGRNGRLLVEFELLALTPEHRREVRASRRTSYLKREQQSSVLYLSNLGSAFAKSWLALLTLKSRLVLFGKARTHI
jgi:hypothetical protein